ncbi:hypothetical protein QM912_08190 [Streptococcus parasanguinis]|jgi:hypothetical protein|uniref:hypothetical protein n=1 Tax=Streptococcus parasanguinis TaxID=1318 RepID=UPI0039C0D40B
MNELVYAINKLGETSIWDKISSFGTIVAVCALSYQFWYDRKQSRPDYEVHIKSKVCVTDSDKLIIKLTLTNIGNRPIAIDAISAVDNTNNFLIGEQNSVIKGFSKRQYKKWGINPNEITTLEIKSDNIFVETVRTHPKIKYPMVLDVGQIHVLNIDTSIGNIDFSKMYIIAQDTLGNYYQSDYNPTLMKKIRVNTDGKI